MDPFFSLVAASIAMFGASLAAGLLPLAFQKSRPGKGTQVIAVLGAGLILGSAFIVIIPEGVSTLYSKSSTSEHDESAETHGHASDIGLAIAGGFVFMLIIERFWTNEQHSFKL
jgi:zinc transporter 9